MTTSPAAGFFGHLTKPVDFMNLQHALRLTDV